MNFRPLDWTEEDEEFLARLEEIRQVIYRAFMVTPLEMGVTADYNKAIVQKYTREHFPDIVLDILGPREDGNDAIDKKQTDCKEANRKTLSDRMGPSS